MCTAESALRAWIQVGARSVDIAARLGVAEDGSLPVADGRRVSNGHWTAGSGAAGAPGVAGEVGEGLVVGVPVVGRNRFEGAVLGGE